MEHAEVRDPDRWLDGPYCGLVARKSTTQGLQSRRSSTGAQLRHSVLRWHASGPDPSSAVVERGDPKLGDHRFFDNIVLGELNNHGDVSFSTTSSEPLVDPVKVWRGSM